MPKVQAITSRDNPLLAQVRRLIRQPDAYRKHAVVWLEGEHLCRAYADRHGAEGARAIVSEGGWDLPQSIEFSQRLKEVGVDLIDCSSGGLIPGVKIPVAPSYQVPFAAAIRREVSVATGAVGMITEARQAESIIENDEADVVFLARVMWRDPYGALHAAKQLGVDIAWPEQYLRAKD